MRIVTGFYPPTSGRVTVGGFDIVENPLPAKRLVGYLPENAPAYADMTVHGFLSFAAELRGLTGDSRKKAISRVVELCHLDRVLYQTIDTLSKGYKHRTCLAQSLIHDPDILILDEPTDGLDPNQKHEARELIKRMGEKKAIVFSTHILEEVEQVCTRVIIIDRGRIVADGTPQELKARSELAGAVRVSTRSVGAAALSDKLAGLASRTEVLADDGAHVVARAYPRDREDYGAFAGSIAELAQRENWKLDEIHVEEGRLDEVFRSITLPDTVKGTV
jgi:ABC-2 type transport system ATP-binding protein